MRFVLVIVALLAGAPVLAKPVSVERIEVRGGSHPAVRLQFSGTPGAPLARTLPSIDGAPPRIYVDFASSTLGPATPRALDGAGPLVRVRTGQFDPTTARVVLDLSGLVSFDVQTQGRTVTIALGPAASPPAPASEASAGGTSADKPPSPAAPPAQPTAPPPPARTAAVEPTPPPAAPTVAAPAPAQLPPARPSVAARDEAAPAPPAIASEATPLVIIDPGHGGRDPGASGLGGAIEKDIVLAVSRTLAAKLEARGVAHTVLTRSSDRYLSVEDRLPPADSSASLFVSLHANACIDPSRQGIEVFYGGGSLRPASLGSAASPESTRLARAVTRGLRTRVGGVRGGPRTAGFGVLARNPLPSLLVEIAYITHAEDAARAQDPLFQDQFTDALVEGIVAYLRDSRPRL